MADTKQILSERGKRYGNYLEQARISAALEQALHDSGAGVALLDLEADQLDAIRMIFVKISRVLNGDPDYADNWQDIAGYATLIANRLEGKD